MVQSMEMTKAAGFDEDARQAVYRAIRERRDVRRGFLPEPMPDDLLGKLLEAAHNAPSVGLMQPWRFIVVRDIGVRQTIHKIFLDANQQALGIKPGQMLLKIKRRSNRRGRLVGAGSARFVEHVQNLVVPNDCRLRFASIAGNAFLIGSSPRSHSRCCSQMPSIQVQHASPLGRRAADVAPTNGEVI